MGLAALDRFAKTLFTGYGDDIEEMVADFNVFSVQHHIRIEILVEAIVVVVCMGEDVIRRHWAQGNALAIVDKGNGIIDRRDELRNLHIQFSMEPLFCFPEGVDIFGRVQGFIQRQHKE